MKTDGLAKLTLVNLEDQKAVEAYFNPKEITIDKSVPWNKHKRPKGNIPLLEFTNAENRTLSLELFFDTFETRSNVYHQYVEGLLSMTLIPDPEPSEDEKKRPPRVKIVWGNFPKFEGVIESLSTKYTMFLPDGTPVRATCTLKLKEADKVKAKIKKKKG